MWKILGVCCVIISCVASELCTNKSEISCDCKQLTDEITHLPVFLANCRSRAVEYVPTQVEEDINYLDLAENEIQILGPETRKLSSNNLNVLILRYNKITKIINGFFDSIPNLVEIDLSSNLITEIEDSNLFKNLNKLTKLNLSFNRIKSLPDGIFSPLNSLRFLDISFNYLGEFLTQSKSALTSKLKANVNLLHLNMNGLNISQLHNAFFDEFKEMKSLSLTDNNLDMIPTVPYSLEKLDLSGNMLTSISAKYLNYHSLQVLKLNRMSTLTDIHHYAFYNLYALEKLIITDCPNLKQFSELAFDVASKNNHLHPTRLSLARNGLESLNESYKYFFRNMEHVDLRNNPWNCDCDIIWLQEFESVLFKPHEIR